MLHLCAECGQFEIWDWILSETCFLYLDSDNFAGETSLMVACREGQEQFVRDLISKHYRTGHELAEDRLNVEL